MNSRIWLHEADGSRDVVACPGSPEDGCRDSTDWSGGWIVFADASGDDLNPLITLDDGTRVPLDKLEAIPGFRTDLDLDTDPDAVETATVLMTTTTETGGEWITLTDARVWVIGRPERGSMRWEIRTPSRS